MSNFTHLMLRKHKIIYLFDMNIQVTKSVQIAQGVSSTSITYVNGHLASSTSASAQFESPGQGMLGYDDEFGH